MREVCEAYTGISPLDFEQMHQDQILALIINKKILETGRPLVTGTPEELASKGLIPKRQKGEKSLLEIIQEHHRQQMAEAKRKQKQDGV